MNEFEPEVDAVVSTTSLSKRAARRLIQRAMVLTHRDRHVRQQIRQAHIIMLWVLSDSSFEWTTVIDHGTVEIDRRPSKKPDLILTWAAADDFFREAQSGALKEDSFEREGSREAWQAASPVVRAFFRKLESVLRHPVDENGVRLV